MLLNDFAIKLNSFFRPIFVKGKQYLGLLASLLLFYPIFIFPIDRLKNSLKLFTPISDEYYFERVFFANNNDWVVGYPSHFVGSSNISPTEIISVGESMQRLLYFFFDSNIILTYLIFSLICLFFVFVFLINCLNIESKNFKASISAVFIGFFVLFSRFSPIPNDSFQFSRMISPQFPLLLWCFEIFLIAKVIRSILNGKSYFPTNIAFTSLVVISLYSHYPYLFLSSIFSFVFLQIKVLKVTKQKIFVILNFLLLFFGSIPHIYLLLKYRNTSAYRETLGRIGLIESRFPGALYIMATAFSVLIIIRIIEKNIFHFRLDQVRIPIFVLKMTTFAILLSSQSNLITGYSIQFSDHFNILMNINLIILVGIIFTLIANNNIINLRLFNYLNLGAKFWKNTRIIGAVLLIFVSYQGFNETKEPWNYTNFKLQTISIFEKFGVNNVIVDADNLQQTIGAVSGVKVLYSSTQFGYGFTNKEVLDRFWISKGCPSNLSQAEKNSIYGYTIVASEQKIARVEPLLRIIDFDFFNNYLNNDKIKLAAARNSIKTDVNELTSKDSVDCLDIAESLDINAIIYTSDSRWNSMISKDNYPVFKLGNGFLLAIVSNSK